jgi:hypothetical protein
MASGLRNRLSGFLAIDKVNRVYDNSGAWKGPDFTSRLLDDIGVSYLVGNAPRLKKLPAGPFITVSNHPYGGLDGIITIDFMARIRPDYKFIVNRLLSMIKTLTAASYRFSRQAIKIQASRRQASGASVMPLSTSRRGTRSASPFGSRIRLQPQGYEVRDRRWQESILHLIQFGEGSGPANKVL